jgi:hypothetical protein
MSGVEIDLAPFHVVALSIIALAKLEAIFCCMVGIYVLNVNSDLKRVAVFFLK